MAKDEEQGLKETLGLLLEDLKTRIGNTWKHIDERCDMLSGNIHNIEKRMNDRLDGVNQMIDAVKKDLNDVSNRAFNTLNKLKQVDGDLFIANKDIDTTIKEVVLIQDKISVMDGSNKDYVISNNKSLNNITESISNLPAEIKTNETSICSLKDEIGNIKKSISSNFEIGKKYFDQIAELVKKIDKSIEFRDSIKKDFLELSSEIKDLIRGMDSLRLDVTSETASLTRKIDQKISKNEFESLINKITEAKNLAEQSLSSSIRGGAAVSSSWQDQMEIKIARMEKNIKEKS